MTTLTFAPRQRSNTNQPYGSGSTTFVEWPTAYTAQNCHVTYSYFSCTYYDLAIVNFGSTGGFSSPGYSGFAALSDSSFTATYNATTGYPSCFGTCFTGVPIADFGCGNVHPTLSGGSTSNSWPWSDGSNPMWAAGCDFDVGQSGSPLINQSNGAMLGVLSVLYCDTNCVHSAYGARINTPVFNWMLSHR